MSCLSAVGTRKVRVLALALFLSLTLGGQHSSSTGLFAIATKDLTLSLAEEDPDERFGCYSRSGELGVCLDHLDDGAIDFRHGGDDDGDVCLISDSSLGYS
jgi:hypothetical protein